MTKSVSFPQERAINRLGSSISLARRRRHWSQQTMAEQIGASVSNVRRLEAGDAGVAIRHVLGVLEAFGSIDQFNSMFDPRQDIVGQVMQESALPTRVRDRSAIRGRRTNAAALAHLSRVGPRRVLGRGFR